MSRRRHPQDSLLGVAEALPGWVSRTLTGFAVVLLGVALLVVTDVLPSGIVTPGRVTAAQDVTASDAPREVTAAAVTPAAPAPDVPGAGAPTVAPTVAPPEPTATGALPLRPRLGAAPQAEPVAGPQPIPQEAVPAPSTVTVAALGIAPPVVDVARDDRTGELVPPESRETVGWFAGGPAPGERGPAVIAGHVDSREGPASFYSLRDLVPGDEVSVGRATGGPVAFRVTRVEQYDKGEFPSASVYGPTPGPELRLITCGGIFDPAIRSYRDNVVVYAVAV